MMGRWTFGKISWSGSIDCRPFSGCCCLTSATSGVSCWKRKRTRNSPSIRRQSRLKRSVSRLRQRCSDPQLRVPQFQVVRRLQGKFRLARRLSPPARKPLNVGARAARCSKPKRFFLMPHLKFAAGTLKLWQPGWRKRPRNHSPRSERNGVTGWAEYRPPFPAG